MSNSSSSSSSSSFSGVFANYFGLSSSTPPSIKSPQREQIKKISTVSNSSLTSSTSSSSSSSLSDTIVIPSTLTKILRDDSEDEDCDLLLEFAENGAPRLPQDGQVLRQIVTFEETYGKLSSEYLEFEEDNLEDADPASVKVDNELSRVLFKLNTNDTNPELSSASEGVQEKMKTLLTFRIEENSNDHKHLSPSDLIQITKYMKVLEGNENALPAPDSHFIIDIDDTILKRLAADPTLSASDERTLREFYSCCNQSLLNGHPGTFSFGFQKKNETPVGPQSIRDNYLTEKLEQKK